MERLSDPDFLRGAGMYGHGLLNGADPSKIAWSFVLYERGDDDRNHVRVHADSLNRPFDINSGSKLQLGSTAKLRTLVTYLEIIAELHDQLADLPSRELSRLAASAERRAERLGRLLSGAGAGPQPAADARSGAAAALFGGAGGVLHRRRRAYLRQFRDVGRLRQPDRPRSVRELDQPVLYPGVARHPELLHRGRRRSR